MVFLPEEGEITGVLHTRGNERFLGVQWADARDHALLA